MFVEPCKVTEVTSTSVRSLCFSKNFLVYSEDFRRNKATNGQVSVGKGKGTYVGINGKVGFETVQ